MKLNDVVLAENIGLLNILRTMPLRDRQHRYDLRAGLAVIDGEIKIAFAERDRIIEEVEPKTKQVAQTHPKYGEVVKKIMDFWDAEASAKVEPCIYAEDLEGVALSVQQETVLESLGLMIKDKPEPKAPRPARMHVPTKKRK